MSIQMHLWLLPSASRRKNPDKNDERVFAQTFIKTIGNAMTVTLNAQPVRTAVSLVQISLKLTSGQIVSTLVRQSEAATWGRAPGHVYTVFDSNGGFVARWKVTSEGRLESLSAEKQSIRGLTADVDKYLSVRHQAHQ